MDIVVVRLIVQLNEQISLLLVHGLILEHFYEFLTQVHLAAEAIKVVIVLLNQQAEVLLHANLLRIW